MKALTVLYIIFQVSLAAAMVSGISGCASTNSSTYYDPLYFNSSDRTKVKYANTSSNSYKNTRSEATLQENRNDNVAAGSSSEYYREAPSQYLPSNQANVGHSNIQQQGSTGGGDTYINNYYDSYQQNHNRRNNSWWQPNTMFFVNAAPAFYTPIMPMRRSWWGRPTVSVGIGWSNVGGWHSGMNWGIGMAYNPWYYSPAFGWYDPFYSHLGYYDPFWYGSYNWGWRNYAAWHSPYRNFYQVNNNYYGNNNSGGGSSGDLGGGRILPAQPRGGRAGHASGIDNNLPGGGRVGAANGGGRIAEGTTQETISGGRVGRGSVPDRYAPNTNTSSYGSSNSSTEYVRPTRGTKGIENNPQNSNTNTYTPSYETGRVGGGRVPQQNYQQPQYQQETMFQQQQRQSRSNNNDFFNDRPSRNESFSSPRGGGGSFSAPSGGGGSFSAPSGGGGGGRGSRGGR